MESLGTWPRGEFQNSSADIAQKSWGGGKRVLGLFEAIAYPISDSKVRGRVEGYAWQPPCLTPS